MFRNTQKQQTPTKQNNNNLTTSACSSSGSSFFSKLKNFRLNISDLKSPTHIKAPLTDKDVDKIVLDSTKRYEHILFPKTELDKGIRIHVQLTDHLTQYTDITLTLDTLEIDLNQVKHAFPIDFIGVTKYVKVILGWFGNGNPYTITVQSSKGRIKHSAVILDVDSLVDTLCETIDPYKILSQAEELRRKKLKDILSRSNNGESRPNGIGFYWNNNHQDLHKIVPIKFKEHVDSNGNVRPLSDRSMSGSINPPTLHKQKIALTIGNKNKNTSLKVQEESFSSQSNSSTALNSPQVKRTMSGTINIKPATATATGLQRTTSGNKVALGKPSTAVGSERKNVGPMVLDSPTHKLQTRSIKRMS